MAKQIVSKACTERSCFDVCSLRQHHADESPEHPGNVSHHLVQGTLITPAGTRAWGHITYPGTGLTHNQWSSLKTVSPNVVKFTTAAWSCKPYLLERWLPWDTSSQFGTSKSLVFGISSEDYIKFKVNSSGKRGPPLCELKTCASRNQDFFILLSAEQKLLIHNPKCILLTFSCPFLPCSNCCHPCRDAFPVK